MMLSVNLFAKERRGAKLIITKKDGQQIEGELITVKKTSLLLLNTDGKDESIDIADIMVIRIVKKSSAGKGALNGLLIWGGTGALVGGIVINRESENIGILDGALIGTLFLAPAGALIGAIIGGIAGTDKTIQLEGMNDLEKRKALDKLRKKARIRNYR